MERQKINEIIVVEGIHDKQAVERVVEADIWVIGGDRIAREMMSALGRAARYRGVIVLTDPDGPGERIRQRLALYLPACKHAFVHKSEALLHGRVGVEHASNSALLAALQSARPTRPADDSSSPDLFILQDLVEAGLAYGPDAASRRAKVGEALSIGYGNVKSFLRKLNALGVERREWEQALLNLSYRTSRPNVEGDGDGE